MENMLAWFEELPTKGKIAVAAGGGGLLLLVWQPWKKKAAAGQAGGSTYVPGFGTGTPSFSSGAGSGSTPSTPTTPAIPVTTPTTPATPTPGLTAGDVLDILKGWKTTTPPPAPAPVTPVTPVLTTNDIMGILNGWHAVDNVRNNTPAPTTPTAPTYTPSPMVSAPSVVQSVNDYLRNTPTTDASTLSYYHNKKLEVVTQAGLTLTPDGHVLDPKTGQYASGYDQPGKESAAAMAIHQINEYVATNVNTLTQSQVEQLHSEKVAAAAQLGYTVTATGTVLDQHGNQAPGIGYQPTPQSDYHTAPTQSYTAPTLYNPQPTSAPASKVDVAPAPPQYSDFTNAMQNAVIAPPTDEQKAKMRAMFGW